MDFFEAAPPRYSMMIKRGSTSLPSETPRRQPIFYWILIHQSCRRSKVNPQRWLAWPRHFLLLVRSFQFAVMLLRLFERPIFYKQSPLLGAVIQEIFVTPSPPSMLRCRPQNFGEN